MTRPAADREDQAAAVAVGLTRDEVRAALHAVDAYRRGHAAAGRPVPQPVIALLRRLETVHRTTHVESPTRQVSGGRLQDLQHDWITTGRAAELLDVDHRTVQRRAQALGGQKIHGRWMFPAATIQAMRNHKEIDA
ncbi:hypothetical protein MPUL_53320 [Mycolicibacterium pulveris]|uniref:Helix-turn-helix domain-containing protein n=1 Tax=Mycolicibacterium pulveris TaxID=36813 RepID=A0A7I7URR7_MYCPV|nr:hypothetical protein MPUL_53320 [Mycolicibacterium pulveris]